MAAHQVCSSRRMGSLPRPGCPNLPQYGAFPASFFPPGLAMHTIGVSGFPTPENRSAIIPANVINVKWLLPPSLKAALHEDPKHNTPFPKIPEPCLDVSPTSCVCSIAQISLLSSEVSSNCGNFHHGGHAGGVSPVMQAAHRRVCLSGNPTRGRRGGPGPRGPG